MLSEIATRGKGFGYARVSYGRFPSATFAGEEGQRGLRENKAKLSLALLAHEAGNCIHQVELREDFQFAVFHFDENSGTFMA